MDLIDLARGQPLGPPPQGAVAAAQAALASGGSSYTPPTGLLQLRQAVATTLLQQQGRVWNPETEVAITTGASGGLAACIQTLSAPGEPVWVPDPGWPGFRAMVEALGRRPVAWPPHGSPSGVPSPRLLLLACPDNPTGRQLSATTTARLQTQCTSDPGLVILADETYRDLVFDGAQAASPALVPTLAPHTVVLRSFSKSHAMAGWRVGYLAAPAPLAARVLPLLTASHACPSTMAQQAALWLLTQGAQATAAMCQLRQARRDRMLQGLTGLPGLASPSCEGGLYLFLRVGGASRACAKTLEHDAGVRVSPGLRFGSRGEGHIRLCFDREDPVLDCAIERIIPALTRWLQP